MSRLGKGSLVCGIGILTVLTGCSTSLHKVATIRAASTGQPSTSTGPSASIPIPFATPPTSVLPDNTQVSLAPGTLTLSDPSQSVTFVPSISTTRSFGQGRLTLSPASASAVPRFSWQWVAESCRTTVGCYEFSPITVTLALATGGSTGSIQDGHFAPTLDNTLSYVISQPVPCTDPGTPEANTAVTCTFVNVVNATSGAFYGGSQFQA